VAKRPTRVKKWGLGGLAAKSRSLSRLNCHLGMASFPGTRPLDCPELQDSGKALSGQSNSGEPPHRCRRAGDFHFGALDARSSSPPSIQP
jgi:hypothetical protein